MDTLSYSTRSSNSSNKSRRSSSSLSFKSKLKSLKKMIDDCRGDPECERQKELEVQKYEQLFEQKTEEFNTLLQKNEAISDSECREKFPCTGVQGSCEELIDCDRKNRDTLNRLYLECLRINQILKTKKDQCISIKRKMEKADNRIEQEKNKEWRLVKTAATFVVRQIGIFDERFLPILSDDPVLIENVKLVKQYLYKYSENRYESFSKEKQKHILYFLIVVDLKVRATKRIMDEIIAIFHAAIAKTKIGRSRSRSGGSSSKKRKTMKKR